MINNDADPIDPMMTHEEIGQKIGMRRQRAWEVEHKALRKLWRLNLQQQRAQSHEGGST